MKMTRQKCHIPIHLPDQVGDGCTVHCPRGPTRCGPYPDAKPLAIAGLAERVHGPHQKSRHISLVQVTVSHDILPPDPARPGLDNARQRSIKTHAKLHALVHLRRPQLPTGVLKLFNYLHHLLTGRVSAPNDADPAHCLLCHQRGDHCSELRWLKKLQGWVCERLR